MTPQHHTPYFQLPDAACILRCDLDGLPVAAPTRDRRPTDRKRTSAAKAETKHRKLVRAMKRGQA